MSVPPDSPWRGAAAVYAQPLDPSEFLGVEALVGQVYYINCHLANPRLDDIIYRSSEEDQDIRQHVYRWDLSPYREVFTNGFQARRETNTPSTTYFNLNHYVHNAGRPLESTRPATHALISTTLDSRWRPRPTFQPGQEMRVYRYEINAPGGIWVSQTLGNLYQCPAQDEVCFIGAIACQYIRSAQLFQVTREFGSRYPTWRRADDTLLLNAYFNPQSHPYRELRLRLPVVDYKDKNTGRKGLKKLKIYPVESDVARKKRQASDDPAESDAIYDWYANRVEDIQSYINAAFRARSTDEAYLFMENEYVLVNYAPGSTNDWIVNGPLFICDGYPSLIGTAFGEYGIDSAFDTDSTEAFIFSGKLCAYIDYAPGSKNDKILQGPMTITAMFSFFKDTVFENGIDAAFRSTTRDEAYLFKGNQYALIDYNSKSKIAIRYINKGFYSLIGTIFESGIEAAFASHRSNEAYIFKGDQYAFINFAPGSTDDYIIGGVKKIPDNWPSLGEILPRKNRGLDEHDHHDQAQGDRDQDL
ncbi:uncharacterized protein LOC127804459 [Diospyros lotus]|uniref:uncharacterized protein LOC127804459 n=1 Tax=Diospyros lotus TaxID=55363 RepID=UPI00224FEC82|nr:uncharacterized protein LOC127804459 [Diospyros lotus]